MSPFYTRENNFELNIPNIRIFRHKLTEHYPHNHEFFECVYVEKGSGFHIVNNQRFLIKEGDFFTIDPQVTHDYRFDTNNPLVYLNLIFTPDFIDKSLSHCQSFYTLLNHYLIKLNISPNAFNPSFHIFKDSTRQIYKLFILMLNEYQKKTPAYLELIRCYLIEFMLLTFRSMDMLTTTGLSPEVYDVLNQINEKFTQDITLSELCQKMHYSVSYISKKIKEETGNNFIYHLQNSRINYACRLLANTNKKVSEIALLSGYNDEKYFQTIFKAYTGLSPRTYKKQYKKI